MKIAMVFPPEAYFYQPYLAPFLLKSYLEVQDSSLSVNVIDLNIKYHNYIWSRKFLVSLKDQLVAYGFFNDATIIEGIISQDVLPHESLRSYSNYNDWSALKKNATLLNFIPTAIQKLNMAVTKIDLNLLPSDFGQWQQFLKDSDATVVSEYLNQYVVGNGLDDFEVLCLSVAYAEQILPTLMLASQFKKKFPNRKVILGGGIITHFIDDIVNDLSFWEDVDFIIPFEGEFSLLELLRCLKSNTTVPAENIAYKLDHKIIYQKNLSAKPKVECYPNFSDLTHDYPTPETVYPFLTSKGCYWGKCEFCTHHEGYGQGFQNFKNEKLIDSLEKCIVEGAKYFYMVDEALPPAKLKVLGGIFEKLSSHAAVSWASEARMEKQFNESINLEILKKSGCKLLISGIESGSQRVSNLMKKGIDLEKCHEFAKKSHEVGIRNGWMFFVGFPGETELEAEETFKFIESNRQFLCFASIGTFSLEKGSPLLLGVGKNQIERALETDKPYSAGYDYILKGSDKVISRTDHAVRLGSLKQKYKSTTEKIFSQVLDRTLALFFPDREATENDSFFKIDSDCYLLWYSSIQGSHIKLDLNKNLMSKLKLKEKQL